MRVTPEALLVGIDLGGTKTEGVVMRPCGTEVLRHRVPTVKGDYTATLATIADLVGTLAQKTGYPITRVGVGIPGSIAPNTGKVRNANSTWINGKPLPDDLAAMLGVPLRFANDANCLALSEFRDGAAIGCSSVFAAILGTGVGGGLILNGALVEGAHGLGGEWGHVPLAQESELPPCFCGRFGCNEQFLSGPAIVRDFVASGGTAIRPEQIVELAQGNDRLAKQVLARHLDRLGRAIGAIVNVFDPQVIVLGGGISNLAGLAKALPEVIAANLFTPLEDRFQPDIRLAKWGDSSGVRGAARLWEQEIEH